MAVLINLTVFLCLIQVSSQECWDGWVRYQDSCYLINDTPEPWPEASALCQAFKARLAIVESSAEDNFLRDRVQHVNNTINYWLDGTDFAIEGNWEWASTHEAIGHVGGYTNWTPGQPDDWRTGQDCLALTFNFYFKWDDVDCAVKSGFICEHVDSE